MKVPQLIVCCLCAFEMLCAPAELRADDLQRLQYNHPGLKVDLGVGLWAWPLPMDWDGDGDIDLVVSCPDKPYNGVYFFENPAGKGTKQPVFKRPVRIGKGHTNIRVSHVEGKTYVLTPGRIWANFLGVGFEKSERIADDRFTEQKGNVRARQWQVADWDDDGDLDVIVGEGFWGDYGWDDAYDPTGRWTNGPLHGWLYLLRNKGSTDKPSYEAATKIEANGRPIDVFGMPSPNLADFDGDGDLDILCGEFLDGFTYFQNVGDAKKPSYAVGKRLEHAGRDIAMHVQMITPTAIDWDGDGDQDLIVGDEDGRVALVEHTGTIGSDGVPEFLPPVYFQQEAGDLKFGALSTPVGVDWDGDGDEDIIAGNTSGNIAFFENLNAERVPKWAAPVLLQAGGEVIHIQAGPRGSIQGPCEAKWGYTTQTVADWDHDGLLDLVVNSIWGKIVWYRNEGTTSEPKLREAMPIEVEWEGVSPKPEWNWWNPKGKALVTQWRTTPVVVDWDRDGLNDLVMLDHEGYLALFRRTKQPGGKLLLQPGIRTFVDAKGDSLRLNAGRAGRSGRRKLSIVDWDGDGDLDLLANSSNAEFYRNDGTVNGVTTLTNQGNLAKRNVAGHTSSPTTIDLDGDGKRELLVGSEDGRFYIGIQSGNSDERSVKSGSSLKSGEYHVVQSWSQEKDFERPYFVNVPKHAGQKKLPVLIFLHGNGGTAKGAMRGFLKRYRRLAAQYILVFADGYKKSWNIVSERSKADDRGFIESIIESLCIQENVQKNSFSIMGSSNGAALVNQLAIESKIPNVRNYVSGVSPLNTFQHDGKSFKAKGDDNNYERASTPMRGKRLMNISGTEDRLVPYRGGPSKFIPAKGGKLSFVDAEESIFLWAKQMGYKGKKLSGPSRVDGKIAVFSYLDGAVVHYKVMDEGHGATGAISEKVLIEFLNGGVVE